MEKISIIVPIYNTNEVYLKKCIETITSQTYKNIEILLIDDGSLEKTANLCDEIAQKDERIICIHKKNEGVSVARNTGVDNATGNWILFVDSDDWLEHDAVENYIKESVNCDIVVSKTFFNNEKFIINYKQDVIENNNYNSLKTLFGGNDACETLPAVWAKMYKRKLLIDNKMKFEKGVKMGEDWIFNVEAFLKVKKIRYIQDYTYHYRIDNEDSVTVKFDDGMCEKYLLFLGIIEKKYGNILRKNLLDSYMRFIYNQMTYLFKINVFTKKNIESNKEKSKRIKKICEKEIFSEALRLVELKNVRKSEKYLLELLRNKHFLIYVIYYTFIEKYIALLNKCKKIRKRIQGK